MKDPFSTVTMDFSVLVHMRDPFLIDDEHLRYKEEAPKSADSQIYEM